jgi:hypothetical protein
MSYSIGQKPGVGRYCCNKCSWSVYLNDADDVLPPWGTADRGNKFNTIPASSKR